MPAYFFPESRDAAKEITRLFEFVSPTAVALWNLRWQVKGYVDTLPDSTPEQLAQRFVQGSELHGVNLKRSCIEISWEEQKSRFASVVLTNAFAAYENWAAHLSRTLQRRANGERLQFPNSRENNGHGTRMGLINDDPNQVSNSRVGVLSNILPFLEILDGRNYEYDAGLSVL